MHARPRIAFPLMIACLGLSGCGDERSPAPDDIASSPTAKPRTEGDTGMVEDNGAAMPARMRSVHDRLRKRMAMGNRMPGMPSEAETGDARALMEAARRLQHAQQGMPDEAQLTNFIRATEALGAATSDQRGAILQAHRLSEMQYRMTESLFRRAEGHGPSLNEAQRKHLATWLSRWSAAREVRK